MSGLLNLLKQGSRLFDYSRMSDTPSVPQRALTRAEPPARGVPDYVQRIAEPDNMRRVNEYVDRGLEVGAGDWYNTMPLRDRFISELGDAEGQAAFDRFIDMVGATSSQSRTPVNARNASYYYMRDRQGDPLLPGGAPPESPYGHYTQRNHMLQSGNIVEGRGLSSTQNPKIASFAENLRGNYEPLTIDIHNSRALGLTNASGTPLDTPNPAHYAFLEDMQAQQARDVFGIEPARYQSAMWVGGGDKTGLASPPDPFLAVLEDRIMLTADRMGINPETVLRRFIRGEMPLLSVGGAAGGGLMSMVGGQDPNAELEAYLARGGME
jgi:hypothetical protein